MTNKEAIEYGEKWDKAIESRGDTPFSEARQFLNLAIKALEKDKCSTCMHYDKDYGETCLNPSGTCRVFEYDGYEEVQNETD